MNAVRTSPHLRPTIAAALALLAAAAFDQLVALGVAHDVVHGALLATALLCATATGRRTIIVATALAAGAITLLGASAIGAAGSDAGAAALLQHRLTSVVLIAALAFGSVRLVERRSSFRHLSEARERDARLMAIAGETAQVGGWSVELPTMQVTWSDEVARIHGEPPGTAPTVERALDYYHPDDRPVVAAAVEACLAAGTPFDVELRLLTSDRRQRWVRATGRAVRDAAGSIVAIEGAFQDVTLRVEGELALAEATANVRHRAEELATTLDRISDAFFTLDADWRFGYVNPEAERLLGRSADELLGEVVWDAFPDAVGTAFEEEYRAARRSGRTAQFEAFFEGLALWFEVRAHPTGDALAVFFRDVTERRASRERLNLLEAAVEQLDEIIMITEAEPVHPEPHPRVVYTNEAFERITGYSREEVYGRSPRLLQGADTDPAERARIRSALEAWTPVRSTLLNYRKDGTPMWIDLHIVPVADEHGWFTHWIAVERDVTEERAQTERWATAQRMESIGQLTGGMAHDFNNLLTVIGGSADLLRSHLTERPHERRLVDTILTATDRGAKLTQSLLAFARKQPLDPKPVDARAVVAQMRLLLERTLGENVELGFDAPSDGELITFVDPHQLESAILNLVLNARDAMPDGGHVTVEIRRAWLDAAYAERHDDVAPGAYVVFAISDTGAGIDPEVLKRVFEPFFTTKAHGVGSGLGLAMVYGFAKQSRGHVSIYSEVGEGTTVRLYVPEHGAEPIPPEAARDGDGRDAQGGERIVLVEDDDHVRSFAAAALRGLGYLVQEARNGAEALELLAAAPETDLLFTDVVMPGGMNGRQLADAATERLPGLRVLFTSGYTENAIVHHGRLDPGVELLSKPYRHADLARRVRAVLDAPPRPR